MKTNRLLAGMLACAMVFGAGAVLASAEGSCITARAEDYDYYEEYRDFIAHYTRPYDASTGKSDNSAWQLSGLFSTSSVVSLTDAQKAFKIPSSVNGQPVTRIGSSAFDRCSFLKVPFRNCVAKINRK